jgi:hypothetical protein
MRFVARGSGNVPARKYLLCRRNSGVGLNIRAATRISPFGAIGGAAASLA